MYSHRSEHVHNMKEMLTAHGETTNFWPRDPCHAIPTPLQLRSSSSRSSTPTQSSLRIASPRLRILLDLALALEVLVADQVRNLVVVVVVLLAFLALAALLQRLVALCQLAKRG